LDFLPFFKNGENEIIHQKDGGDGLVVYIQLLMKDFDWICHKMLPPEDEPQIAGCEVLFPDTAFFDLAVTAPGRAKDIVRTDQNGCLTSVTQE
jgi:hypothetical protein